MRKKKGRPRKKENSDDGEPGGDLYSSVGPCSDWTSGFTKGFARDRADGADDPFFFGGGDGYAGKYP